jgi:hypothetical protein
MPHPRLATLLFAAAIATGSSLAAAPPSRAADNPIYQIQRNVPVGATTLDTTYTTIAPPGAVESDATGVIRTGFLDRSIEVVGWYTDIANVTHGFIWMSSTGQYTTLNVPGSDGTTVYGINHDGEIIGTYGQRNSQPACFFLYVNGGFQPENFENCGLSPGYNDYWAVSGINDSSQIVGVTDDCNGPTAPRKDNAFFEADGGIYCPFDSGSYQKSELNGINDQGDMVGDYTSSDGSRQAFYLNGKTGAVHNITDLPGSVWQANGINDAGDIVGNYITPGCSCGFIQDGTTTDSLSYPGSLPTSAQAISDQTNVANSPFFVVGSYVAPSGIGPVRVAFLATVTPRLAPFHKQSRRERTPLQ